MNRPQRIVLVCNSYPPEIGAAPVRMHGLAQQLRRAGHQVTVIAGMPSYPFGKVFPQYRWKLRVVEEHDGVVVHRLPYIPHQSGNRALRIASLASLTASLRFFGPAIFRSLAPDWVVVSSPPLPMARIGLELARNAGAKVLLNISDLWPHTAKELGALQPGKLYSKLEGIERKLLQGADAWMGQSEEILAHIKKQAGVSRPSFLYRNLPETQPEPLPHTTGRRIVYAGLLGPVQGIANLVTSADFKALGTELHIYGGGPDRRSIEKYIRANPDKGIFLHDPLPMAEMAQILPEYDVALVPLRRPILGAIPSKLFAACAAGLPLLFCAGGEGEKLVQRWNLGLTAAAGDVSGFRTMLSEYACSSPARHTGWRNNCLWASETVFGRKMQEARFRAFFESLQSARIIPLRGNQASGKKIRATIALIISAIVAPIQKF